MREAHKLPDITIVDLNCFPQPQLAVCPPQLDLFPDVQEACVAELIQKNNVKDLNV